MRRLFAFAAGLAAASTIVLVGPARAADCPGELQRIPAGGFYFVVDKNGDQWIYQESNGVADLQRGGKGGMTGQSGTDNCADPKVKKYDTIIF